MWTNGFSLGKLDGSNFLLTQNHMHMPSCDNDIFQRLLLTQGPPVLDRPLAWFKTVYFRVSGPSTFTILNYNTVNFHYLKI